MSTFTAEITTQHNDGYRWPGDGSWTDDDLYLGHTDPAGSLNMAVRFPNVTIGGGATISSAKLSFKTWFEHTNDIHAKIYGIDQDNTAEFPDSGNPADNPTQRTKTTASVDWDRTDTIPSETYIDTADITSIVQEIVDRGSWSSGNAMGFILDNDGFATGQSVLFYDYERWSGSYASGKYAVLTITYTGSSPSLSPSLSPSITPSASPSLSPSISSSRSPSASISPSPSEIEPFFGLKIIKREAVDRGKNVLTTQEPTDLIFSSDYGTLKYFEKLTATGSIDANAGDIATKSTITHGLNYYPYVEVFVSVYIGDPTGIYEYCPFFGSGASVAYNANYKITTTTIELYGEINGVSTSTWTFDFLVFIYKNNLNL